MDQTQTGVVGSEPAPVRTMIVKAQQPDAAKIAALAAKMWDHPTEALAAEFVALLKNPEAAVFAAKQAGEVVGFSQCQLRHDYVEGASTSPVGYLEGIYVEEGCRRQGVARALLQACEAWARSRGCTEFASDCELTNKDSLGFHRGLGFTEANRIICFTKKIPETPSEESV